MKFARDRKIYDRQPTETDKQWRGFTLYRDLGLGRSMREASLTYRDDLGITTSQPISTERCFHDWSVKWRWRDRITEWERFLDKKKRQKAVHAVEAMKDRHIKLGNSLQVLGAQELQKWIQRAKNDPTVQVTVGDLLRAIEAGIKLERLSRGEPETVAEERRVNDGEQTREALVQILEDSEAMDALDVVMSATRKDDNPADD